MQSYENHRQYVPWYHFFAVPVIAINVIVQVIFVFLHFSWWAIWNVVLACGLGAFIWTARTMVTRAQDRIIRLEETLRLQRLLPGDLQVRIGELRPGQLVALRFASDEEVPALVRLVLNGELRGRDDIKRRITKWRPDTLRV